MRTLAERVAGDLSRRLSRGGAIEVLVESAAVDAQDLADALRRAGDPELDLHLGLLTTIRGPHDRTVPSVVYGEIGASYRVRGQPELARKFYERALENAGSVSEGASVRLSLGLLTLGSGKLEDAERSFSAIIALGEKGACERSTHANALLNAAAVSLMRGRPEESRPRLERALEVANDAESEVATAASLQLAQLALNEGDAVGAEAWLSRLQLELVSPSNMDGYHLLKARLFEAQDDAAERLARLNELLARAATDGRDLPRFVDALRSLGVPMRRVLHLVGELGFERSQSPRNWLPILRSIRQAALASRDVVAFADASCTLVESFAAELPDKVPLLEEALRLTLRVSGAEVRLVRARSYLQLGTHHLLGSSAPDEETTRTAIQCFERALNASTTSEAPPQLRVRLEAPLHSYLGMAYRRLAKISEPLAIDEAIRHLHVARDLTPPDADFDWLRQQIQNNLANAEAEAAGIEVSGAGPLQGASAMLLAIQQREQLVSDHDPDQIFQIKLHLNLVQDYRDLVKLDRSVDHAGRLEKAAFHAERASQLNRATQDRELAFIVVATAANVALDRELVQHELARYAEQLDATLAQRPFPATSSETLKLAYSTSARLALRAGKRALAYRRWLQGARRLRAHEDSDASVMGFRSQLATELLGWDEPDRALIFVAPPPPAGARWWPVARKWRCRAKEALVLWSLANDAQSSWILLVDSERVHARRLGLNRRDALQCSGHWLQLASLRQADDERAQQLWSAKLARFAADLGSAFLLPIADLLPARGALFLAPDAFMQSLPLHISELTDVQGRRYVLREILATSYVDALAFEPPVERPTSSGLFVAAHSPAHARLLFAELEVAGIQLVQSAPAQVALANQATSAAVLDGIATYDMVHLSCHGSYDAERPLDSTLLLADRSVSLREIELRLKQSPCSLIVLSCCEAGAQSAVRGQAPGFPGTLLRTGCGAVIAAPWRVDDLATAFLMGTMHQGLARGLPPAVALSGAQAFLRRASGGVLALVAQTYMPCLPQGTPREDVERIEARLRRLADDGLLPPFAHVMHSGAFYTHVDQVGLVPR